MDEEAVINLIDTLSDESLEKLLSVFQSLGSHTDHNNNIKVEDFKVILGEILNIPDSDERLSVLCKKIDIAEDGFINENKLIAYLLQQCKEKEELNIINALPFESFPVFIQNIYSKQTTCRFISLPSRFISVSKDGIIATWSASLELQKAMIMNGKENLIDRNQLTRLKHANIWVTDAAIISHCNILVISTTSRELSFFDISSTIYKCMYKLCDLPSVPFCMTSYIHSDNSCYIFIGNASGNVIILHFINPSSSLFAPNLNSSDDDVQLILYSHLSEHNQHVTLTCLPNVHTDWIHKIMYLPQNHSIITCSTTHQNSLILQNINKKLKPYVFNLTKGVTCFDFNFELNFLVTGSPDHVVRFWDPYVPSSPVVTLNQHTSPVVDVLIHKEMHIVCSFSRDLTLCIWDLFEHTLLQKVSVKFSFSQRLPDFSSCVLCLLSPTKLAVMCNEYIAVFVTSDSLSISDKRDIVTHSKPLVCAVYDPRFQQVVSGSENGEICMWNVTNGTKVQQIRDCHNNVEMTFLSFDGNFRRLITASRLGEIKIWNYLNGECLNEMQTVGNTEITAVIHLYDKSQFLSAGWNRKIVSFSDESEKYKLQPDNMWSKNAPHHNDDILTMTYCSPYIATGSFDGDIIVWNIETTNPIARFKSLTQIRAAMNIKLLKRKNSISKSEVSSHSSFSRPASRRLSRLQSHSSCYFQNVPVDKLLFLPRRMTKRQHHPKLSVLVSSEAGNCRFWSFPGEKEPQGTFSLTCSARCVLAICSDPDNQYLVAGDSYGYISLFDISAYCTAGYKDEEMVQPVSLTSWKAHAQEILSVEYISHETQPLILSSSGDCTVRLWNIKGHYIGTFGQDSKWNLSDWTTFQHPLTPWKDSIIATEITDVVSSTSSLQSAVNEAKTNQEKDLSAVSSPTESRSSLHEANMELSLFDKKLCDQYVDKVDQRIADKQERRQCYADVDMNATEKFGSLCSPYQALQLLHVDDLKFPNTISDLLHDQ